MVLSKVTGTPATASSENGLEMQILGLHPQTAPIRHSGDRSRNLFLTNPPGDSEASLGDKDSQQLK